MEIGQVKKLCISLAGHDRGTIYAVIREEEEFCYLADGRLKTLDKLKKKRKKHVQMITRLDEMLLQKMADVKQDSDLIHILKLYSQRQNKHE